MRGLVAVLAGLLLASSAACAGGWTMLTSRRVSNDPADLWEYDLYLLRDGVGRRLTDAPGPEGEAVWSPWLGKVVFTGSYGEDYHLWAVDLRGGPATRLTTGARPEGKPTVGPGGREVVYPRLEDHGRWVLRRRDLATGDDRLLLERPGNAVQPEWSPRGDAVAFVTDERGNLDVALLDLATGAVRLVADGPTAEREPDWSPDGATLCYTRRAPGSSDVWLCDLATSTHRRLTDLGAFTREASFAPDGRSVVFVSHFEGPSEVYRVGLDGQGLERLTRDGPTDSNPRLLDLAPAP